MCLAIVLHRAHPDWPLVVAANRDELLARPSVTMTVLQEAGPRIHGGKDLLAGGTWLATNEHGVVAALTNRPALAGPAQAGAKRSRGALPLALAQHATAAEAVRAFVAEHRPRDYNPAWLLCGDRDALFYLDMSGDGDAAPVTALGPGLHVLENAPYGAPSPKVDHVAAAMAGATSQRGEALVAFLAGVLGD
ncbi:MAG: NRDE family protein, partial [Myxococcota bacterium]